MRQDDYDNAIKFLALRAMGVQCEQRKLIDWAFTVLEHGLESKHLLWLAGLSENSDILDMLDFFEAALIELGAKPLEGDELLSEFVRMTCRQFLEKKISADRAMNRLNRICDHTEWDFDREFNLPFFNLLQESDHIYHVRQSDPALADKLSIEFNTSMTDEFKRYLDAPVSSIAQHSGLSTQH
ncbi:MAG TPA: hypothetical protein VKX17_09585 [Planctomycetota bacterium]|nr:hypothetical protein [Planctomycetota bacterium]